MSEIVRSVAIVVSIAFTTTAIRVSAQESAALRPFDSQLVPPPIQGQQALPVMSPIYSEQVTGGVSEPPASPSAGYRTTMPPTMASQPQISSYDLASAPTPAPIVPALTQEQVEQIVADYLARREADQKASEPPKPEFYEVGTDKSLSAKWNNGLELESKNKDFKVHVGGRTQFDTSFFANDANLEGATTGASPPNFTPSIGNLQDSMQFRRARFRIDGTMYEQIDFAFEYEFLNLNTSTPPTATSPLTAITVPAPTDLWVNFSKLPIVGNIKIGNQKPMIGFEHLESSRYLDFIERSFNQDLFYGPFNNGFSPGIVATNTAFDNRASWAVGAFAANMNAGTNIFGFGIGNDYSYVMRGTVLPHYEQDGRYLWHLGASMEFRSADDGHVRVRTRGNIRNGPPSGFNSVYADTTLLSAENQDLLNIENVWQFGPLLFQSEYCFSMIYNATQTFGVPAPVGRGDVSVSGGYIEALYFLTGEHRVYSFERAAFDRVVPNANAFRVLGNRGRIIQGMGAWQVGIRYDRADLNDNGINGGMLNAVTFGVNWFLNPNMKLQANWDWTHRGSVTMFNGGAFQTVGDGDVFGFGTRMAIDF